MMLSFRKSNSYLYLGVICAFVIGIALLTTFIGKGILIQVSDNPTGGHIIRYYEFQQGCIVFHHFGGVLTVYHRFGQPPPFTGIDWSFTSRDPVYNTPAEQQFRIANWFAAIPFAVCAWWCRKKYHQVQSRAIENLCPICGYDLRAHKPGQKCPECGTEIPRFGWRRPT